MTDLAEAGPTEQERRWREWAAREFPGAPDVEPAVSAALRAVAEGVGAYAAAAAGTLAMQRDLPPGLREGLANELATTEQTLAEVRRVQPTGRLTRAAIDRLVRVFERRVEAIRRLAGAATPTPSAPPMSLTPAPAAATTPMAPADAEPAPSVAARPGAPPVRPVGAARPAPSTPSAGEFFGENGILLISYLGAFLLIVAVLLFEIYGSQAFDGGVRFAAVLGLTIAFGVVGRVCLGSEGLRLVGRSYVAVFAFLVPLSVAAAYVFLVLDRLGLTPSEAVAFGGLACAVLYAILGVRLGSVAYVALAMTATMVGWLGLLHALDAREWTGPAVVILMALYTVAGTGPGPLAPFGRLAAVHVGRFVHLAAAVALGIATNDAIRHMLPVNWLPVAVTGLLASAAYAAWALARSSRVDACLSMVALALGWLATVGALSLGAWSGAATAPLVLILLLVAVRPGLVPRFGALCSAGAEPVAHVVAAGAIAFSINGLEVGWPQVGAFAGLTLAYFVPQLVRFQPSTVWLPALGTSLTVLSAVEAFGGGAFAGAAALTGLGVLYALVRRQTPGRVRHFFTFGSALQALLVVALPITDDLAHGIALAAASGVGVLLAVADSEPAWLLLAEIIFGVGWYWILKTILPAPVQPVPDDLVRAYAPLGPLFAVVGIALRNSLGRGWAWPMYLGAALVIAIDVLAGISHADAGLVAVVLLVSALLTYTIAILEREALAVGGAALLAAGGAVALLAANAAPAALYAPVVSAVAVVSYALGQGWPGTDEHRRDWRLTHRVVGLAGAALVVGACLLLPIFWEPRAAGPLAAMGSTAVLALLLFADAELEATPISRYGAAVAVSLMLSWLSRYVGATNPEFLVLPPGLCLVVIGTLSPGDARVPGLRAYARAVTGTGLVLVMGTAVAQSLGEPAPWSYTGLLLAEAVSSLLLGVSLRSRALVVGGAAAAAMASLRALLLIQQQYPLFVVFGIVALLLLAGAALLAVARDRLSEARQAMGSSWQEWH